MTTQFTHRCLLAALLAVAIALAGCGPFQSASGPSCSRADADFDEAATRLTFELDGADAAQIEQTRSILCDRLGGSGVDHRVQPGAGATLTVDVPKASDFAEQAAAGTGIFGTGRAAIYDWEANVAGPGGDPAPGDASVTGGTDAGHAGALALYDAVRRAALRPAAVEADNARTGSRFYAVDPNTERVFAEPGAMPRGAATRAEALGVVPAGARAEARVYEVKPDTVIVHAEPLGGVESDSWFVLRDDAALNEEQIVNPKQDFDEGPGGTGEPIVTFEFAPRARALWHELTRELADRGSRMVATPGAPAPNQHFAVVVDDVVLSVPYIDFAINPDGIDASTPSLISGALTIASARQLAALLGSEPLPVALVLAGSRAAP